MVGGEVVKVVRCLLCQIARLWACRGFGSKEWWVCLQGVGGWVVGLKGRGLLCLLFYSLFEEQFELSAPQPEACSQVKAQELWADEVAGQGPHPC